MTNPTGSSSVAFLSTCTRLDCSRQSGRGVSCRYWSWRNTAVRDSDHFHRRPGNDLERSRSGAATRKPHQRTGHTDAGNAGFNAGAGCRDAGRTCGPRGRTCRGRATSRRACPSNVHHTGRKIRYTVGRLDRRPGAGARRHLSRALHHRARPARPRRAHFPRRSLFRIVDRGGRMGASQRNRRRHRCHPKAAHSEHPYRRRYDCRICNRLCCICALWFSVAGCRFRPARPRGSGHIGSSIAAWACACRSRHCRSLHYTFARPFGESELLGALYLSGNGDGGGICAGTTAPLALAGGRRRCAWCPLDAAWRRISERHGIGRASVSCRGWLRPCGDVDRVRFTVRSFRRSRKNR